MPFSSSRLWGLFSSTASIGNVVLTNDAQSANIFWIVEGAVSMGASTHTEGTILGAAAIAFGAQHNPQRSPGWRVQRPAPSG